MDPAGQAFILVVCDEGRQPALADAVDEHESFTTDLLPLMQVVDAGFLSRLCGLTTCLFLKIDVGSNLNAIACMLVS